MMTPQLIIHHLVIKCKAISGYIFQEKICIMRHELQGISGNEAVDILAKEGATEVSPNHFTAIPFSAGKKTHQEAYGTEASGQVDCLYWLPAVKNPLPGRDNELLAIRRLRLRAAVGLLTATQS